jgi:hypothetical protein
MKDLIQGRYLTVRKEEVKEDLTINLLDLIITQANLERVFLGETFILLPLHTNHLERAGINQIRIDIHLEVIILKQAMDRETVIRCFQKTSYPELQLL